MQGDMILIYYILVMKVLSRMIDRVVAEHCLKVFTTGDWQDCNKSRTYYLQMIFQYFLYENESQLTYLSDYSGS